MALATVKIGKEVLETLGKFLESKKHPRDRFNRPLYKNRADAVTQAVEELLIKHGAVQVKAK